MCIRDRPYGAEENRDVLALFDERFDELYEGLKEMGTAQISLRNNRDLPPGLLTFPLEFAGIKPALRTFLSTLFETNPFQYKPVFRGFYFTSAPVSYTHLVDQVAQVQLAGLRAALDLHAQLAVGVVEHDLVVARAAELLALEAAQRGRVAVVLVAAGRAVPGRRVALSLIHI